MRLRSEEHPEIEIREPEPEDGVVSKFQSEFMLNPFQAQEICDWFEERNCAGPTLTQHQRQLGIIKTLDYAWKRPGQITTFALCYAPGMKALDDVIGHMSMSEFARKIGVTKEAVRKAVDAAQRYFQFPPRTDQRNGQARANMSQARNGQLK